MKKQRHYRGGYQFAGSADLARDLRTRQTEAEALLWKLLRNRQLLGFKFRRQHQFGDYIADFYCHEVSLVIECDGSVHDQNEQWQHDQNRDVYMVASGLRVLRFTNNQIVDDPEMVLKEISKYLHAGIKGDPPLPFGKGKEGKGFKASVKPSPLPSPKGRGR